jgi:elongation factor G
MSKIVLAETITKPAEAQATHSKIFDNGSGEFAVVRLRLEPLADVNAVLYSGAGSFDLSPECQAGIEDGVYEAAHAGVLNSGRVIDVQVTLLDAKYHELDSSRRAFRLAAFAAFQEAMRKAGPLLVTPAGN